jgi:hypothetical protein
MENIKNRESEETEQPENKYPVRKVCAWCEKDMSDSGFFREKEGCVTHGMCPECAEKQREARKK